MNVAHLKLKGQLQVGGILAFHGTLPNFPVFWTFTDPAPGTTLNGFTIITGDGAPTLVRWGDNTVSVAFNGVPLSKTY